MTHGEPVMLGNNIFSLKKVKLRRCKTKSICLQLVTMREEPVWEPWVGGASPSQRAELSLKVKTRAWWYILASFSWNSLSCLFVGYLQLKECLSWYKSKYHSCYHFGDRKAGDGDSLPYWMWLSERAEGWMIMQFLMAWLDEWWDIRSQNGVRFHECYLGEH